MRLLTKILFILLFFVMPVLAGDETPVFTDQDLEKYGGSGGSTSSTTDQETSLQKQGKQEGHTLSPLESDLRRRKDDVAQENLDYIEGQYQWMKTDCQKFEGELRKDCFFRTEAWRKEQLRQVEGLKDYLGK